MAVRIGAVSYLNARPLVHGLERVGDFAVRFDPPARCATLLHDGAIDVGLIPSIELAGHADYRVVPDAAIVSDGAVRSVALFSKQPLERVRSIALDSSSRTSVMLLRVLSASWFDVAPRFAEAPPDLPAMLGEHDAALVIGDPALEADEAALGVTKIDLGEAWTTMTGLPFVWAFWAGRDGALEPRHVDALLEAKLRGVRAVDTIARDYYPADPRMQRLGARYLCDNIKFDLRDRELAGLARFYAEAAALGLASPVRSPEFFAAGVPR